jgi:HlyD family secretion protein
MDIDLYTIDLTISLFQIGFVGIASDKEPSAFTKVSSLGVEEQRVNAIGDFVDPYRLGDAYRVDVQIVIWQGKDVLQVPLSALFRCNRTNWCTFVVKDGKVDRQQVSIGQRSDLAA